jgi:hypothetical protein
VEERLCGMEWLANVAKEYGLFVALVTYVLWDSRQREQKYINVIEKLSDSFREIKADVTVIKQKIERWAKHV